MSEYQYYEFRAVDRPLDETQMAELRRLSSRAEITPTSFTNTYNYGDFRGRPDDLIIRYFDAFVYVANWGSRRLMLRVPRRLVDIRRASEYEREDSLEIREAGEYVVLDFRREDESSGDYEEGERWMASLIPLRAQVLRGDLRALYIGWLAALQSTHPDDLDEDQPEPAVPPGLGDLSTPLKTLAEFLGLEVEWIEVAAAASTGDLPTEPGPRELGRWIKTLPAAEKDAYLVRFLAEEGDLALRAEILNRYHETTSPRAKPPKTRRRTVGELFTAYKALVEAKRRKAAERAAEERARRAEEEAAARAGHLKALARREAEAWRDVERLIAVKRAREYDEAVAMLEDLSELASRSGRGAEAESRIRDIRRDHANKTSFIERLNRKRLGI